MPTHASLPGFNVTGMEHPTVAVPIPTHFDPETFDIAETPDMAFKMSLPPPRATMSRWRH